jgi:hypothetical protein
MAMGPAETVSRRFALYELRPTTIALEGATKSNACTSQPRIPTGSSGKSLTFRTPEDFEYI